MKSTGIVRKIDDLGRLVIPMEIRRKHKIETGDGMEIYTDGQLLILKAYKPGCDICGEVENRDEDYISIKSKKICRVCKDELKELL